MHNQAKHYEKFKRKWKVSHDGETDQLQITIYSLNYPNKQKRVFSWKEGYFLQSLNSILYL